ncbi:hypothetical protein [Serratia fonticola]
MRKLTIMGHAIFFMNENEAYPSPDSDAGPHFSIHIAQAAFYA